MADTQRTRAALIALLADNSTGNISEQDIRDVLVTLMEVEFANPGDFWNQPKPWAITTDKTGRGWKDYSQVMLSACSFGNVLYLTASNTWGTADIADSTMNPGIGVAMDSYAAAESQATILRRGIIYNSALSARFSGFIGRPVYLQSALNGSISVTTGTSEAIMGYVVPDGIQSTTSSKWFFDPQIWTIYGV